MVELHGGTLQVHKLPLTRAENIRPHERHTNCMEKERQGRKLAALLLFVMAQWRFCYNPQLTASLAHSAATPEPRTDHKPLIPGPQMESSNPSYVPQHLLSQHPTQLQHSGTLWGSWLCSTHGHVPLVAEQAHGMLPSAGHTAFNIPSTARLLICVISKKLGTYLDDKCYIK